MIESVAVRDFEAIPYLESSALMDYHRGRVRFSTSKVNVVMGPNGSGKTALLDALSMRLLADMTGESALNDAYVFDRGADRGLWRETAFRRYEFLPGLHVQTDNGPAIYYKPMNIPGGESSVAASMMMGYEGEAREYARLTSKRSSGEAGFALLQHALQSLGSGAGAPKRYGMANWRFGSSVPAESERMSEYQLKAEILRKMADSGKYKVPVVIMDEPEQSLDARAQATLWDALGKVTAHVQVIVATHSLHPLLRSDRFNVIECEEGYVQELRELSGLKEMERVARLA